MNKHLRPESKLVQQGSVSGNVAFTVGNMIAGFEHPIMATSFILGNFVGLTWGQENTGVVVENSFVLFGYAALTVEGMMDQDMSMTVAGLLGMACATKYILDNFRQSKLCPSIYKSGKNTKFARFVEKLDNLLGIPAKLVTRYAAWLQQSTNPKLVQRGHDIEEISERSMFKGAAITIFSDVWFAASALIRLDIKDITTSFFWISGTLVNAVSIPKDGNKNIFQTWFSSVDHILVTLFIIMTCLML